MNIEKTEHCESSQRTGTPLPRRLVLLDRPRVARCSEEKENNFYSSDSDFDDEEPKKFHIQIRPVASSNRSSSAATEKELKATVGSLTLPPNRTLRQKVAHLPPSLPFSFSSEHAEI